MIGSASYLAEGFRLLARRELRAFAIAPVLVNTLVFAGLIWLAVDQFDYWVEQLLPSLPEWLAWLEYLLWPVFALALLVALFYGFASVANLIAAPFNGLLAERVDALLGGQPAGDDSLKALLALVPRTLGRELQKLGYSLPRMLALLVLVLIPGLNLLSAPLWFLFGAWMQAVEYTDYCSDNRRQEFRSLRAGLRRHRWEALGFGVAVNLATMVPLLNLVAMPAAVCGGTKLWRDRLASE